MERSGLVDTVYAAVTMASVCHASALGENASSGKEMVRLDDDDSMMCALVADEQSSVAALSNPKKEQY